MGVITTRGDEKNIFFGSGWSGRQKDAENFPYEADESDLWKAIGDKKISSELKEYLLNFLFYKTTKDIMVINPDMAIILSDYNQGYFQHDGRIDKGFEEVFIYYHGQVDMRKWLWISDSEIVVEAFTYKIGGVTIEKNMVTNTDMVTVELLTHSGFRKETASRIETFVFKAAL